MILCLICMHDLCTSWEYVMSKYSKEFTLISQGSPSDTRASAVRRWQLVPESNVLISACRWPVCRDIIGLSSCLRSHIDICLQTIPQIRRVVRRPQTFLVGCSDWLIPWPAVCLTPHLCAINWAQCFFAALEKTRACLWSFACRSWAA